MAARGGLTCGFLSAQQKAQGGDVRDSLLDGAPVAV